jgi:streptogramin lyase
VDVTDVEPVRAADLGDRLTVIAVPDPREPDLGNSLESLAVSDDAVWVVSHRGGIVSRIDPATNEVVAVVESRILPDCRVNDCVGLGSVHVRDDDVWLHNQYLQLFLRIDTETNEIVDEVSDVVIGHPLPGSDLMWSPGAGGGAVGRDFDSRDIVVTVDHDGPIEPAGGAAGSMWFTSTGCDLLLRVDPVTGAVQATIPAVGCARSVVEVGGEVWASSSRGIMRIDPATDQMLGRIRASTDNDRLSLVVVGDSVWFRTRITEIVRIDAATAQPMERITLPPGQYQAEIGGGHGSVWVANWAEGTVYRIED